MTHHDAGHRPVLQWGRESEAVYKEIAESDPRKLFHTIFGMFKHHQPYAGTKLFARLSLQDVTST